MFRRRRSFSRFRSRFKRRKRSVYPHQGGVWNRAQFCIQTAHASSDQFADILWSDLMGVNFHLGDPNTVLGDTINSFARYVEVRAIRCHMSGYYVPNVDAVGATVVSNYLFAGLAVDNMSRDSTATAGAPLAATLFDPFVTQRPIKSVLGSNTDQDQDTAQPVRWLKREWSMFNGGNFAQSSASFTSTGAQFNRSLNVARRFRLDDFTGLYLVTAFRSDIDETHACGYQFNASGCIWYRVSFGR